MFYLLSITAGGWLSNTGQFTSERNDAKPFIYEDAVERCRRAMVGKDLVLVPVFADMIEDIIND